jgi:YidC/Oxa1 family membrane protein insertase
MDTQRLILLVIFSFSLLMLWEAWEKEQRPKPAPPAPATQQSVPAPSKPTAAAPAPAAKTPAPVAGAAAPVQGEIVRVSTDLVIAEIDTLGGTLKRLELLKHKDSADPTRNFVLLGPDHKYEAQSGLIQEGGPNHLTPWVASAKEVALLPGQETVEMRLTGEGRDGVAVEKVYTFKRNSYVVDVALEIRNRGAAPITPYAYFQLTHDGKPSSNVNAVAETFGAQSFTGFGLYTPEKAYEKVHPSDLDKAKFERRADNGWLAFVQHYFVSAWLPRRSCSATTAR